MGNGPPQASAPDENKSYQHIIWGALEVFSSSASAASEGESPGKNSEIKKALVPIRFEKDSNASSQGEDRLETKTVEDQAPPPKSGRVGSFSLGSEGHDTNQCRPCAWAVKPAGCANGRNCEFCHLCDISRLKARKKERMARLKAEKRAGSAKTTLLSL